ncbi:MAG TPA: acyltransferase [Candidatus Binatia bacterium]|nr:acyltransferase [Candidatus Binatia bacterium]
MSLDAARSATAPGEGWPESVQIPPPAAVPLAEALASVRPGGETGPLSTRAVAAQALGYLTNHLVNRIPSHSLRRGWYRRALGIEVGTGAGLLMGLRLWFYGPGQVRRAGTRIGAGTRINRDCALDTRGGLRIGDHVSISPEVVILTADHDRDDPEFPLRHRAVVIEDHVWIGMRAMILPGVRIGRGAVVAAGAVVSRDVEPLTVVAGIPARPVGRRDPGVLDYALDAEPLPLFE